MLWERSHTDISFQQATKPKIIRTPEPCYHYLFCKPKPKPVAGCHFHALAGTVTARASAFAPSVPRERIRGQGAGEQGGHSWLPCPSTDMRHRPCPSGSAFAAVCGRESTTYD